MIDKFGRSIDYMRISVTDFCNLRCRYCMPEDGVARRRHEEMLTAEETVDAVKAAVSLGIKKIRITGGEPLVKRGIVRLCDAISAIEGVQELCMTTNGTLLPQMAKDLRAAGVSRLNISLDTLVPDKYRKITRVGNLSEAINGIDAAFEAGFEKIKINNVLIGGFNEDEIKDFVRLRADRPIEVRFIELMPIGGGMDLEKSRFISCSRVLEEVPELKPMECREGVAELYRLPGAKGQVGLIRPISCEFCGTCNKIRLTADGMLKPCLHSAAELCIKGLKPDGMKEVMRRAILSKPEMRDALDADNPSRAGRSMNSIGG